MTKNSNAKRVEKAIAAYEKAQELHPGTDEKVTVTRPSHPEEAKKIRYLV